MNNPVLFNKKDLYIISGILILCAVVIFFMQFNSTNNTAVIMVDDKTVKTINLAKEPNGKFTIDEINNVVFEINNGRIRILESDCPNKICVNTGYISSPNQVIICVPKKIMVKIVSNQDDKYDVVVG